MNASKTEKHPAEKQGQATGGIIPPSPSASKLYLFQRNHPNPSPGNQTAQPHDPAPENKPRGININLALNRSAQDGVVEPHQLQQLMRRTVGKWVSDTYRRRPMIMPVVVDV